MNKWGDDDDMVGCELFEACVIWQTRAEAVAAERDRLLDDFFKACQSAAKLKMENDRLRTALQRIRSLAEKNVVKHAQQIANAALAKEAGE